jgi:predicted nucleotidyltransferase
LDNKNKGIKKLDQKQALNLANRYIDEIKSKYDLRKALLFGSFAKGTNNENSDIDIALIFDNVTDIIDLQIELMKMRRNIDLRIEPHPFDESDFNVTNPAASDILNYGIEIGASLSS